MEWGAGEALNGMAALTGRRKKRRREEQREITSAMLKMAVAQAFKPLHALPDLAILFVTEAVVPAMRQNERASSTSALADEVATLLPPSTLIVAVRATGVIGPRPCSAEEYAEEGSGWAEPVREIEEAPALVVMLGILPGIQLRHAHDPTPCSDRTP